jgi:hypothetical protein
MMKRMGISDEDLDTLNNEMLQAMSGVENIEDLPGGEDAGEEEEVQPAEGVETGGETPGAAPAEE